MKILSLKRDNGIYASNVYFVLGSSNAIEDVNTLVDVGRDHSVIEKIEEASTGIGKQRVEQVILTHSHYDHTSLLPQIKEIFRPKVYAWSSSLEGVDHLLRDGETLRMGNELFEVIYMPGHSNDSICLYCHSEGVLFVGDSPVIILSANDTYEEGFINGLIRLVRKNIKAIYFGHGDPLLKNCNARILTSLKYAQKSLDSCR